MEIKQGNFQDIVDTEREFILQAPNKYGDYWHFALAGYNLVENCIKSINPDRFIFAAFLSQIRKHHTLALLSSVRLHHIQAMMNLRQVLEATSCAAYAIAHPEPDDFVKRKGKIIDPTKDLTIKRYKWLEENYPEKSEEIKRLKGTINSSTAHSNIVYAHKNYYFDLENGKFDTPFFDFEDTLHVKGDLWLIGNMAMGLMDFLYGVNLDYKKIVFNVNFAEEITKLQTENDRLKKEALGDSRFDKLVK